MRIIKHGSLKQPTKTIRTVKFKCVNCGCIFEEDTEELRRDCFYTMPCPDCGHEVFSNKYKDIKYLDIKYNEEIRKQ